MERPFRWKELCAVGAAYFAASLWFFRPFLTGKVLIAKDLFRFFIPLDDFFYRSIAQGQFPLWLPNMRLGQPFVAMMQPRALDPFHLAALAWGPLRASTFEHLLRATVAAVGFYALARALARSRPAAWSSGFAFGFAALFLYASHAPNVAAAACWTGWIWRASLRISRGKLRLGTAELALWMGLSLLGGSPETSLWQGASALAFALAWARPTRGTLLALGAGMFGAVLLSAGELLPGLELALHSTRGAWAPDAALAWSASPSTILGLAWPHADEPRLAGWHEDQWFFLATFLGSTVVFSALCARRTRRTAPLLVGALAWAVLSMGEHFRPSAWLLGLPPLSLFRFPSKYLIGVAGCVAALAPFGVDRLAVTVGRWSPRRWWGLTAFLLAAGAAGALAAEHALRAGARWGALWFAGSALAMLVAARWIKGPTRLRRVQVALLGLTCLELLAANETLPALRWIDPARAAEPSELAARLRTRGGRVSIHYEGYDAQRPTTTAEVDALLARSRQELVGLRYIEEGISVAEGYGAPEPALVETLLAEGGKGAFKLAGVTTFLRQEREPPFHGLRVGASFGHIHVFEAPYAFPRAFLVRSARVGTDAQALDAVLNHTSDLTSQAVLAEGTPVEAGCDSAPVHQTLDDPDAIAFDVDACAPTYLMVSDSYYPGWAARIDGVDGTIRRADYAIRAVPVPKGRHRVELLYRPWSFRAGLGLSGLSLVAIAIALFQRKHG